MPSGSRPLFAKWMSQMGQSFEGLSSNASPDILLFFLPFVTSTYVILIWFT